VDQAELRSQLRAQLDEAQRELAKLTTLRRRKQYEWAAEEENLKARINEINRQLSQLRRAVTFPEMFQKVAEMRLGADVYRALMAETTQRLAELDRATKVESAVDHEGPS
jgi:ribosomal protein S4